ncbi:MAG: sorting protein [Phycisphaerales bacterium]|nr:sorting protein [Phycisphaerales bacterium]
MNWFCGCACAFIITFSLSKSAMAVTADLGTAGNAASWRITGAGAVAAPAFQVSANGSGEISLTSNGFNNGTFVSGGSLSSFNGFWYADETFTLPANASSAALTFSNFYGNDRAVLELNGTIIGNVDHLGATGNGIFSFPPGPPDVAYTITGTTSGTVTSGFLVGGTNTLRLIVNNTGTTSISSTTASFANNGDATDAGLTATLTYAVPEPSGVVFFGLAGVLLGRHRRRPVSRVLF